MFSQRVGRKLAVVDEAERWEEERVSEYPFHALFCEHIIYLFVLSLFQHKLKFGE